MAMEVQGKMLQDATQSRMDFQHGVDAFPREFYRKPAQLCG
jgi:hypothetical protein